MPLFCSSSSSRGDALPPRKHRVHSRSKTVQFSSTVKVEQQSVFQRQAEQPKDSTSTASSLWMTKADVDRNKRLVRALTRKHRSQATSATAAAVATAVRCEVCGDSLRGVEHLTAPVLGHQRRRLKKEAHRAVAAEQRVQLVGHVLDSYFAARGGDASAEERVQRMATAMDGGRIAKVYRPPARGSLAYARRLANEDAKVAAEILAQDLPMEDSADDSSDGSKSDALLVTSLPKEIPGTAAVVFGGGEAAMGVSRDSASPNRVTEECFAALLRHSSKFCQAGKAPIRDEAMHLFGKSLQSSQFL